MRAALPLIFLTALSLACGGLGIKPSTPTVQSDGTRPADTKKGELPAGPQTGPNPGPGPQANPGPQPAPKEPKPVATVKACELWTEFGKNELAADTKYKDKYIELTGALIQLQKDGNDKYYIGMTCVTSTQGIEIPPSVYCYISPESSKQFAELKQNEPLKLLGKVVGRRAVKTAYMGYVIDLTDCRYLGKP